MDSFWGIQPGNPPKYVHALIYNLIALHKN